MGFRKGKGTRDAIFQLRMINERCLQMGKKVNMCFMDYQKAFDWVNKDKLLEVMELSGIPELERRLIINLYWHQKALVRWDNGFKRCGLHEVGTSVRQHPLTRCKSQQPQFRQKLLLHSRGRLARVNFKKCPKTAFGLPVMGVFHKSCEFRACGRMP